MSRIAEILEKADVIARDLGPRVTDASFREMMQNVAIVRGDDVDGLKRAGITLHGIIDCDILVSNQNVSLGNIVIHNSGRGNALILYSEVTPRECNINIRFQGSECFAIFSNISTSPVNLPTVFMRANNQKFYWGIGATSVMSRFEIEGVGAVVAVGDDCMLSSGVWVRNHDMHAIFDVDTLELVNSFAGPITFEQHVWLGFEVFVLGSSTVGYGSIIGARALSRADMPPKSLALGIPAKIIRSGVSWSRNVADVPRSIVDRISRLDRLSYNH